MIQHIPPSILIPSVVLALILTPLLNKCEKRYEEKREQRLSAEGYKKGYFGIWYKERPKP